MYRKIGVLVVFALLATVLPGCGRSTVDIAPSDQGIGPTTSTSTIAPTSPFYYFKQFNKLPIGQQRPHMAISITEHS